MSLSPDLTASLSTLVAGCAMQNRDSQKQFYALYYGYAFSICHRYVTREEEAIEVVNDAFL